MGIGAMRQILSLHRMNCTLKVDSLNKGNPPIHDGNHTMLEYVLYRVQAKSSFRSVIHNGDKENKEINSPCVPQNQETVSQTG